MDSPSACQNALARHAVCAQGFSYLLACVSVSTGFRVPRENRRGHARPLASAQRIPERRYTVAKDRSKSHHVIHMNDPPQIVQ